MPPQTCLVSLILQVRVVTTTGSQRSAFALGMSVRPALRAALRAFFCVLCCYFYAAAARGEFSSFYLLMLSPPTMRVYLFILLHVCWVPLLLFVLGFRKFGKKARKKDKKRLNEPHNPDPGDPKP